MYTAKDFNVRADSSIVLLEPVSLAAVEFCADYLPDDCPMFGNAFAIEANYFPAIASGIIEQGMTL